MLNRLRECQNCETPLPARARYCFRCGQRNRRGIPTLGEFLADGFRDFFNVDSRFWRTARDLFVPGKMTRAWFAGKRQRYLPPLRITVVVALALVTASLYMIGKSDFLQIRDSRETRLLRAAYHDDLLTIDTLTQQLRQQNDHPQFTAALDSVRVKLEITDSLAADVQYVSIPRWEGGNFVTGGKTGRRMTVEDVHSELSVDSLLDKYAIEGFWDRLAVRQAIRLNRTGEDFGPYLLTSGAWAVLFTIPVAALLLKLLYIRRRYFYLQHLVFLLHLNAALLLGFIGMVLFGHYAPGWIIGGGFVVLAVFVYVSMLRAYRQHWFKTLIKYLIVALAYLVVFFPLVSIAVLLIRVAFY